MSAIQFHAFPDGGFVLHRIIFASENGKFSAWFDASGTVLDAEQITVCHRTGETQSRPVKNGGPIWRMVRTVGAGHTGKAAK